MRQNQFKTEDFFIEHIAYLESFRPKALKKLEQGVDEPHRTRLLYSVLDRTFDAMVAKYTVGEDVNSLSEYQSILMDDVKKYLVSGGELAPDGVLSQYIRCVWLLSFCYFFNSPADDVNFIARHIPFTGKDYLTDLLINASTFNHPIETRELAFPDVYQPLIEAISQYHDPNEYNDKVNSFLERYYSNLKAHDVTWYDSHKEEDPERCFHFGYWTFEAPALLLSTNILVDDGFREHPLYPKDLADWKKIQIKKKL